MSRKTVLLGGLAIAAFMTLGTQPGRASDPDVDGMDHSKLNHGVLGVAAHREAPAQAQAQAPAPARMNIVWVDPGAAQTQQGDPNVTGMDHSKLNHGVLGVATNH